MEIQDLRIGNIVEELLFNRIGELSAINKRTNRVSIKLTNSTFASDVRAIKPIPLTEEWLLKFGFELDENAIDDFNNRYYDYGDYTVFYEEGCFIFQTENMSLNNPKYVHQLQNLYYALTNEELTIKNQ